jgi:hypothetical protein
MYIILLVSITHLVKTLQYAGVVEVEILITRLFHKENKLYTSLSLKRKRRLHLINVFLCIKTLQYAGVVEVEILITRLFHEENKLYTSLSLKRKRRLHLIKVFLCIYEGLKLKKYLSLIYIQKFHTCIQ